MGNIFNLLKKVSKKIIAFQRFVPKPFEPIFIFGSKPLLNRFSFLIQNYFIALALFMPNHFQAIRLDLLD